MQNMRTLSKIDKFETRPSRYGALDLFIQQTEDPTGIITPELQAKSIAAIGSVLEVPVIDFDSTVTISNTRSVVIPDSENTSRMLQIVFATYSWGFTIVPAAHMNNEISIQRDFEAKFLKYLYAFAASLNTAALAALNTDRTQVVRDKLDYAFAASNLRATFLQRMKLIGDLSPIMASNDFFGQVHIVGNGGIESHIRELAQSGLYNAENRQLQYMDKVFHFTNQLTNAALTYGTGFAVNEGSVGMLTRFEREAVLGTRSATGHEWGIENLPMLNIPVGTYFYESVGDFSAIGGAATADLTRARKEHHGFSADIAFVTPFISDRVNRAMPIIRFEVATT